MGKYDSHIAYGQDGLQVVWNRIIFPDASSVDLAGMEGLDSQGTQACATKLIDTTSVCLALRPSQACSQQHLKFRNAVIRAC